MRSWSPRRLAAPVLVALVVLAGCGGDGDDDTAKTTTTTAPDGATTADDGATTETPGDASETTETTETSGTDDPTDTTEGSDGPETTVPDTSNEGQEGTGAPDEEAPAVDWYVDATAYRGQDGRRIAYLCPPDGDVSGEVYGTDVYADDSKVCTAAVHAGVINPVEGGRVIVEIAPGEDSYTGSEANGVTSQDWDVWDGSFIFPKA